MAQLQAKVLQLELQLLLLTQQQQPPPLQQQQQPPPQQEQQQLQQQLQLPPLQQQQQQQQPPSPQQQQQQQQQQQPPPPPPQQQQQQQPEAVGAAAGPADVSGLKPRPLPPRPYAKVDCYLGRLHKLLRMLGPSSRLGCSRNRFRLTAGEQHMGWDWVQRQALPEEFVEDVARQNDLGLGAALVRSANEISSQSYPWQGHRSCMEQEVVNLLQPRPGGVYLDMAFGTGGHTETILQTAGTFVVGMDCDAAATLMAHLLLQDLSEPHRFALCLTRYSQVDQLPEPAVGDAELPRYILPNTVDGIVLDAGCTMPDASDPSRGFCLWRPGAQGDRDRPQRLDMRYDRTQPVCAADVLNHMDIHQIQGILKDNKLPDAVVQGFGQALARRRVSLEPMVDAQDLADVLQEAGAGRHATFEDPGTARQINGDEVWTRVALALRQTVNGTVPELANGVIKAFTLLKPGSTLCVITSKRIEYIVLRAALSRLPPHSLDIIRPSTLDRSRRQTYLDKVQLFAITKAPEGSPVHCQVRCPATGHAWNWTRHVVLAQGDSNLDGPYREWGKVQLV